MLKCFLQGNYEDATVIVKKYWLFLMGVVLPRSGLSKRFLDPIEKQKHDLITKELLVQQYFGHSDEAFIMSIFLTKFEEEAEEEEVEETGSNDNTTVSSVTADSAKTGKRKGRKKSNKDLNF